MFLYVHHVHYAVEDLDTVVEYLEENFGMTPESIGTSKGNHPAKEAVYYAGITEIQITEPLDSASGLARHLSKFGPSVYHVAWGVKNIETLEKHVRSLGNEMRREGVSVSPRGYKTVNIEKSTSHGLGFQLIEDPEHDAQDGNRIG